MPLTEPAQFTTEKMKKAYKPIVFVEIPGISQYWASRFIDKAEDTAKIPAWPTDFDDVFEDVSGTSISVDREGGFATIGDVALDLTNFTYDAFLKNNPHPENEAVEIYLIFDDGTQLVYSEKLKIFQGQLEQIEVDYDQIAISVANNENVLSEIIGEKLEASDYNKHVDLADGYYSGVLDSAIGQMKPIIYGDHPLDRDSTNLSVVYLGDNTNLAKGIYFRNLNAFPAGLPVRDWFYLIAGHELKVLISDSIWLRHKATETLWNVDSTHITVQNADGTGNATVQLTDNSGIGLVGHAFGNIATITAQSSTAWKDIEDAIDRDIDTSATIDTEFVAWTNNDFRCGYGDFSKPEAVSILTSAVRTRTNIQGDVADVVFTVNGEDRTDDAASQLNSAGTIAGDATGTASVDVVLSDNAGNDPTVRASVYEVYKRFEARISEDDFEPSDWELYADVRGKKDDGSGTITGTPSQLLENPAHIFRDILSNEIGVASLATASFAKTASERSGWSYSFILSEQIAAKALIPEISKKSLFYTFYDAANRWKIVPVEKSVSFSPSTSYVWSETPSSSGESYTQHYIDTQRIPLKKTKASELRNQFKIFYGYDTINQKKF